MSADEQYTQIVKNNRTFQGMAIEIKLLKTELEKAKKSSEYWNRRMAEEHAKQRKLKAEVERLQGCVDRGEMISKEIHEKHKADVEKLRAVVAELDSVLVCAAIEDSDEVVHSALGIIDAHLGRES